MLKPEQYQPPRYGSLGENGRVREYGYIGDEAKEALEEESRHGFLIPPERKGLPRRLTWWEKLFSKERVLFMLFWLVVLVFVCLVVARIVSQGEKREAERHPHRSGV
jgi:hypothetical protein